MFNMRMNTIPQKMWRSMNNQLSGVYQYFSLVFGAAPYQPTVPTDDTVHQGEALLRILGERRRKATTGKDDDFDEKLEDILEDDLEKVREILGECTDLDGILHVDNGNGYNIFLSAVLFQDMDFISVLVDEGCDLNKGKCTLPLHLACKLGDLETVRFLLENGANPSVEMGMCHPKSHLPVRHVPSRFHFLETDIFACDSDHQLPVMYAIQEDHVSIVQCLMEEHNLAKYHWPYHRLPLHYACRHGAYQSMKYLVKKRDFELNEPDDDGMTPLLLAIQYGKKFAQYLVEAGADMHVTSNKQQSALHILYSSIRNPLELYNTTRYLLAAGLEQDVNVVDCYGNTALHSLVAQMNRLVTSFDTQFDDQELQPEFDNQLVNTLDLLLGHNCDPNIVNKSGVTALHRLILVFDFVISNDPTGITVETLPVREKYKVDFIMLHRSMQALLQHSASPNEMSGAGRTSLVMLLHSMLDVDPPKLQYHTDGFLACLCLLCETGARPSLTLPTHIAIVTTLSKFGQKCMQYPGTLEVKQTMSSFLKQVLAVLLQHGLHSNYCSMIRKREVEGGSGNVLIELVKLSQYIRHPSDLLWIHDWILTCLQWGANPDIEPYPGDPIICTSQSSIYLKPKGTQPVNQYMYQIQDFSQLFVGGYALKLLQLFYNSMDHEALYQCLNAAKFMSRFDPNSTKTPSSGFIKMVNTLASQPRTLMQNARVAIYIALERQLNLRVQHLPLPNPLKRYLTNVE